MIGLLSIAFISVLCGALSAGTSYLLLAFWQGRRHRRLNYLPSGLTKETGWIAYLGEVHDVTMTVVEGWNRRSARIRRETFRQSVSDHNLKEHIRKARAQLATLKPEIEALKRTDNQYKWMIHGLDAAYKHVADDLQTDINGMSIYTGTDHTFTFNKEQAVAVNELFTSWFSTAICPQVTAIKGHQLASQGKNELLYHEAIVKTLNTSLSAKELQHNWLERQTIEEKQATLSESHRKLHQHYRACFEQILRGRNLKEFTNQAAHLGPPGFKEKEHLKELLVESVRAQKHLSELLSSNDACFTVMEQWASGQHSDYRVVDMAKTLRKRSFPFSAFSFPDTTANLMFRVSLAAVCFFGGTTFSALFMVLILSTALI